MKALLIVFVGGGIGSVARYATSKWVLGMTNSAFPYGTFVVNIIGCFLIGFLVFLAEREGAIASNWRLFLVTGLCGGFTTFSAFSVENVQLMNNQHIATMLVYTLASIVIGFLATYVGIVCARLV